MKTEVMYFYHLDELRDENNIPIDNFIDGICSERQYWRYRSGENICPQDKLAKFIERLSLSHSEFFNYFYAKELSEFKKLESLYLAIMDSKLIEAKSLLKQFENTNFVSYESKSLYELCLTLFENMSSHLSIEHRIENYSKYIGYPEVLDKTYYSFRDIVLLIEIAIYEGKKNIFKASDRLYEIAKEGITYVSGNSRFFMPRIYVSLVKIFGSSGQFMKALEISQEGINYSKRIQDSRALPNLYHLSALSKYKLGIRDKFEDDVFNCLFCCLSTQSVETYQLYLELIRKEFGYIIEEVVNKASELLYKKSRKLDED